MIKLLTDKEIASLDSTELKYKVDELQKEVKRLNRMLIAMDLANHGYMEFIIEQGQDLMFFKWLRKTKGGVSLSQVQEFRHE